LEWPGNVRELKNVMERLAILCDSPRISGDDVRRALAAAGAAPASPGTGTAASALRAEMRRREEEVLLEELKRTGWNVSEAARHLGIARASLHRKIKEFGLERTDR